MATLKEIIQYGKANPDTDYSKRALELIKDGSFDTQAEKEGVDLSWAGRKPLQAVQQEKIQKESFPETDFNANNKDNLKTGQNSTVPVDWGKVLSDTWNTYQSAPKDFIDKTSKVENPLIPSVKETGYVSKGINKEISDINKNVNIGENALAGTASVLNTIFAPFGAAAKGLTDAVTKTIVKNPDVLKSPTMAKVADFIHGSSDVISKLPPRAANDLGNALTVVLTALSGEEGGKIFPELKQGLDTKILPGTFKNPAPLIDAIKDKASTVIDSVKGFKELPGKAKQGMKNLVGTKTPEEILATPIEKVSKLKPEERVYWFDNQKSQIDSAATAKKAQIDAQTEIDMANIEARHGSIKEQIAQDTQKSIEKTTAEAEALKKDLEKASYEKTLDLKPKAVKTFGKQSEIYRTLREEDMAPFKDTPVTISEVSGAIEKTFPDNPEIAQDFKNRIGLIEKAEKLKKGQLPSVQEKEATMTIGEIDDKIRAMRQDMSSAVKKGNRVYTPDEMNTDKVMQGLNNLLKEKGVDLTQSNSFWREWAPLRDEIVSKLKPFDEGGFKTKTFSKILETDNIHNENFIKAFEDVLGEKINVKTKAIIEQMSENEKTALANAADSQAKQVETDLLKKDQTETLKNKTELQKGKISEEQFNARETLKAQRMQVERDAAFRTWLKRAVYLIGGYKANQKIKQYTGFGI